MADPLIVHGDHTASFVVVNIHDNVLAAAVQVTNEQN
jgi:hypothetical protein